jgi:phage baseplate assembly protein W
MLNVSANVDFMNLDTKITNPFYDLNYNMMGNELYGVNSINQAIDNLLLTEPGERLFNISFFSPLFPLFFKKMDIGREELEDKAFTTIETWVGNINIIRSQSNIQTNPGDHTLSFSIHYIMSTGETGNYERVIKS